MGFLSFISRPRRKQRGGKESQYGFKTLRDPEDAVVESVYPVALYPCPSMPAQDESSEANTLPSLVFLHGLTGDRERTWTAAGHAEPWPQTLLRLQIPNARVLTYGYDANVVKLNKVVSSNRIGDHAGTLLTALAVARDAGEHAVSDSPSALAAGFAALRRNCEPFTDQVLVAQGEPTHHLCGPQPRRPCVPGCPYSPPTYTMLHPLQRCTLKPANSQLTRPSAPQHSAALPTTARSSSAPEGLCSWEPP